MKTSKLTNKLLIEKLREYGRRFRGYPNEERFEQIKQEIMKEIKNQSKT